MFGWDSDAPAVDVKELLGKRSAHSRQVSQVSQASKETVTTPTVAGFAWSSSLPASPTTHEAPSSESNGQKPKGPVPSPLKLAATQRFSLQPPARPQSLNQALAIKTSTIKAKAVSVEQDAAEEEE